jgi:CBS domain-containing protein
MTKVKDVMTKTVITVDANKTVIEAAALMAENDVGNLIVMDDNTPIGIVTERDFVRRVLAKENHQKPKSQK